MTEKFYPGDRQAAAMKEARKAAHYSTKAYEELRMALDNLDRQLRIIQTTDDSPELELVKLRSRIERLRELRNMMELGSFEIAISHALDEAYKRLP